MKCIGELLDQEKYRVKGRIAIIENKETVMKVFGLTNAKWLNVWNIDSRILTLFYKSFESEYDWYIVVYDYPAFCADPEIKEAIIWHELGHIQYPVFEQQLNLDSEIKCDGLAIMNGHKEGMRKVLDLTLSMARTLNHEILTHITTERQMRLPG
ncbi:hypothetical protein [Mesobacillus subterraneus]|uniref:Phage metallopeptidase domain-containing protein n=1 Tax=Mesobacillus subterraneus TaxID=285983 RepID=A0A427TM61_9BACI|nr:hypothetical protein [Mesobacillus subterraneus]RSD25427.1 hypothetical protein EJA10_16595 [Mesobacillus subterraneus]